MIYENKNLGKLASFVCSNSSQVVFCFHKSRVCLLLLLRNAQLYILCSADKPSAQQVLLVVVIVVPGGRHDDDFQLETLIQSIIIETIIGESFND
jgi:hypothetical protein